MFGEHLLKTWLSTQAVTALSSGGAEYYGITEHADGIDTAGLGELILAKHRHGALDTIKMKFVQRLAKFTNYDTFAESALGGAMQPNAAFSEPFGILGDSASSHDVERDLPASVRTS